MSEAAAPLSAGDPAPDFTAETDGGEQLRLRDLRGRKVVLYFYPKDDTSGCTKQACAFRDAHAEWQRLDAVVLGVSPDGVDSHRKFKEKFSLDFPLLVDEDHAIAEKYGVWGEKTLYGKKYMGVIRSHFVIDEDGRIVEARYGVKADESAELARAALEGARHG